MSIADALTRAIANADAARAVADVAAQRTAADAEVKDIADTAKRLKASQAFKAIVAERLQAKLAEPAHTKDGGWDARTSIHYRTRTEQPCRR